MTEDEEYDFYELQKAVKKLTERIEELEESLVQLQFDVEEDYATMDWVLKNTSAILTWKPEPKS